VRVERGAHKIEGGRKGNSETDLLRSPSRSPPGTSWRREFSSGLKLALSSQKEARRSNGGVVLACWTSHDRRVFVQFDAPPQMTKDKAEQAKELKEVFWKSGTRRVSEESGITKYERWL